MVDLKNIENLVTTELEKDLTFLKVKDNFIEIPIRLYKYIQAHKKIIFEITNINEKLQTRYSELYEFYKSEYDDLLLKDREIPVFIKKDNEYKELFLKSEELGNYKDVLEKAISSIKDIAWIAKTKLEYDKFYNIGE